MWKDIRIVKNYKYIIHRCEQKGSVDISFSWFIPMRGCFAGSDNSLHFQLECVQT